jgi:phosphoribosylformylglycinamidine cyclo-ligase
MKVDEYISDLKKTLGEELLTPTKIYVRTVLDVLNDKIHGMAHITGGGLLENLPRILPEGLEFRIDKNSWEVPVIFKIIQRLGKIDLKEMYRTFNMGIGFVMVVERDEVENLLRKLNELGQNAWIIGDIVPGEKGVII